MIDRQRFYDERAPKRAEETRRFYHTLVNRHFAFLVPPGARVLEVGCAFGDTLAAVQPARGVGIDFSTETVRVARDRHPNLEFKCSEAASFPADEKFDYVIASDLINDLPDVQSFFEQLRGSATSETRLVLNFFNTLWRPILGLGTKIGLKSPNPPQNWLSLSDVKNLLHLAGWEVIKTDPRILWPVRTPLIDTLFNRWLAPLFKHFCLTVFVVARPRPETTRKEFRCSVVIPARNEAGNIEAAVQRTKEMGLGTEIIFVEGGSSDNTWDEIQRVAKAYPQRNIKFLKQTGRGKGDAVRAGYAVATGDILFILDADLTMPPEELPKFYEVARAGTGDFVNGVRMVYPMEEEAMRFLNMIANKCFGITF